VSTKCSEETNAALVIDKLLCSTYEDANEKEEKNSSSADSSVTTDLVSSILLEATAVDKNEPCALIDKNSEPAPKDCGGVTDANNEELLTMVGVLVEPPPCWSTVV
jgi:hypothetical protein